MNGVVEPKRSVVTSPAGHDTYTIEPSGKLRCACGSLHADRAQLVAHYNLARWGVR